jgi:hypothetical protein
LIGTIMFIAQYVRSDSLGLLVLPALGLIFLAWGLMARSIGLVIPGGILSGIGLGAFLTQWGLPGISMTDPIRGGIFMLSFALGWALITLLSPLTHSGLTWWPLIPGGILAVVGAALLSGEFGLRLLALTGQGWPVILIVIGLYLVIRQWMKRDE